jgi:hypothetical protein
MDRVCRMRIMPLYWVVGALGISLFFLDVLIPEYFNEEISLMEMCVMFMGLMTVGFAIILVLFRLCGGEYSPNLGVPPHLQKKIE